MSDRRLGNLFAKLCIFFRQCSAFYLLPETNSQILQAQGDTRLRGNQCSHNRISHFRELDLEDPILRSTGETPAGGYTESSICVSWIFKCSLSVRFSKMWEVIFRILRQIEPRSQWTFDTRKSRGSTSGKVREKSPT